MEYLGWGPDIFLGGDGYRPGVPLTAYNAVTEIETLAVQRLIKSVQATPLGKRLDTVMWAASGSEAVIKALWACLARTPGRDIMVATRFGFHGKKGLAGAVTGSEKDKDRDPRVRFISFPMEEISDVADYGQPLDLSKYDPSNYRAQLQEASRLMDSTDPDLSAFVSNTFEMEWPRGSGRIRAFPEIDRVGWFAPPQAFEKILAGQRPILEEALERLDEELGGIDFVLGFDCVHRRLEAENRQVIRQISDIFRRFRVVGFNTYGEQFNAMHLNHTFTGVAFGRRREG